MSYFSVAPTLCEVTYDSELSNEERYTPYRYQCWSAAGRYSNGSQNVSPVDTGNLSLPSGFHVSYYEYLRTLYDSKICNTPRNQGIQGPSPGGFSAKTFYHHGGNGVSLPQNVVLERRPRTAGSYITNDQHSPGQTSICLPSIQQGWSSSHDDDDEIGSGEGSRASEDRLKWIDALNKWIPEQNQTRPYLSFVGNAPVVDKLLREAASQKNKENEANKANGICERFEQHMHCHEHSAKNRLNSQHPENSFAYRLMTLKRREALRQKANDSLEQHRQRKAYSSPLSDRRLKVRFQTPSAPSRPRVTQTFDREPITLPKDISWDGDKPESESSSRVCDSSELDISQSKSVEEVLEEDNGEEEEEIEEPPIPSPIVEDKVITEEESSISTKSPSLPPVIPETPIKEEDSESEELKKLKKSSNSKLTAKVKSSFSVSKSKSNKSSDKLAGKSSSKKIKPVKDASETDFDIEEVATVIPTVGDNKSGPLSLQSGRGSAKKTRVSADIVHARRRQSLFVKKEKKQPPKPRTPTPPRKTPSPLFEPEPEPPEEDIEVKTEIARPLSIEEPALPDPDSFRKPTSPKKDKVKFHAQPLAKLQQKLKRKPFKRDTSYEDEIRRQELAEKRRQKQMEMLEKLKSRKNQFDVDGMDMTGIPNFEDYGFLAKYCIFNRSNIEMFKHTFDIVDVDNKGWLQGIDVMIALRGINNKLSLQEEEYLYRIMELTGYSISKGADFKLFSVLAALSLRISALDDWMKNLIGSMDFKTLEMKMWMCKTLWECNVDKDTNKISLDQLCVELRAGGVSLKHEIEVRQKLHHLLSLDLLDFLTYIPLFIMIHQSVVDNPLSDVRDK